MRCMSRGDEQSQGLRWFSRRDEFGKGLPRRHGGDFLHRQARAETLQGICQTEALIEMPRFAIAYDANG